MERFEPDNVGQILAERYLAWSPDGSRIALFSHMSPRLDNSLSWFHLATGENREIDATGGDCCGYADSPDLACGSTGQFGYGEVDHGFEFEHDPDPLVRIVYRRFTSTQGDSTRRPRRLIPTGAQRGVLVTSG